MSFLRKQESRLLCMCYCVPAGQAGILGYLLDSRLRGNDMPGLAHLADARCFIWLNCYQFAKINRRKIFARQGG